MVKNIRLCFLPVNRRLQQPTFSFPKPAQSPLTARTVWLAPGMVGTIGQCGKEASFPLAKKVIPFPSRTFSKVNIKPSKTPLTQVNFIQSRWHKGSPTLTSCKWSMCGHIVFGRSSSSCEDGDSFKFYCPCRGVSRHGFL
jgi:hypothetical protein